MFEAPYGANASSSFDAWVVPNTTAALHSDPTLKFDATAGASGYSGQLGAGDLLGQFHYSNVDFHKDVYSLTPSNAGLALLDRQVVAGKVRIVFTAIDATTNTGFYGVDSGSPQYTSHLSFENAAPTNEPASIAAFGVGLVAILFRKRSA